ncbi:diacylglycerol kinase family protein [Indiicoccus explosivorum]|uniref:diacylglycerol kinase family protein n=1 Tax=Indiicoccus explosivorum TaxID=1917864 RepID=UPI000B434CDF|nr:diacylglycerol kinase family protein [Indiicoccus explosivorum]
MDPNRFFRSFRFAAQGIRAALRREQNIRFHFLAALFTVTAGVLTGLSYVEWLIILLCIGGMIALELVNTALERAVDLASPEIHPIAGEAKDMAAGAVLVFAVASAIIGLLIFLPKWLPL